MIQAVIFDIGNVLLRFDPFIAVKKLMRRNKLQQLPERGRMIDFKNAYEAGEISREEFLKRVMPEFNHHDSPEDFIRIWEEIFEVNQPMLEIVGQLHQQMPIYLLSNIGCIHHEYIFRTYPVFQLFRDGVFSYRVGCLKPDLRIYQIAIEQFQIDAEKTLFIDDLAENVQGARQAGLCAIQYDLSQHDLAANKLKDILGR